MKGASSGNEAADPAPPLMAPHAPAKPSLGLIVANVAGQGLLVQSATPGGLAQMYGVEKGDIITAVNGRPQPTTEDLKAASHGSFSPDGFTFQVVNKQGAHYGFEVLLPLAHPETNFHGMLMEQDTAVGLHVVTGVLVNSAAARAGVQVGSCIRMVDGILVGGLSDEDIRKMIFGGQGGQLVLGLQPPKLTVLSEFRFARRRYVDTYVFRRDEREGDDDSYCDGWSEKQHDFHGGVNPDPEHKSGYQKVVAWLQAALPTTEEEQLALHAPFTHPLDAADAGGEGGVESPCSVDPHSGGSTMEGRGGRVDLDEVVRRRVEAAIKAAVGDFLAKERARLEQEAAHMEMQVDNLQESVSAMAERLRMERASLEAEHVVESMLKTHLAGIQNSVHFLTAQNAVAGGGGKGHSMDSVEADNTVRV